MPKKVGKYEIGKTLGEGTFGKVKRAVNTEDQRVVAIKVLDKDKIQKQNMGSQIVQDFYMNYNNEKFEQAPFW